MTNAGYQKIIQLIKKRFSPTVNETFERATHGTHCQVYLSSSFVIKFREIKPTILRREGNLLAKIEHELIPKVLWQGVVSNKIVIIENRLPGKTLDEQWKFMTAHDKKRVVNDLVEFLKFIRTNKNDRIYSVSSGKQFVNFYDYLTDGLQKKISRIRRNPEARTKLEKTTNVIFAPDARKLFNSTTKPQLVHGDLINHNLLTNGKTLTGVLDWELATYGDPEYDIFRLKYYQECAQAYVEQGTDISYEADFMREFMQSINSSHIVKNIQIFERKYEIARAIFRVNALHWATTSSNPDKNVREVL